MFANVMRMEPAAAAALDEVHLHDGDIYPSDTLRSCPALTQRLACLVA